MNDHWIRVLAVWRICHLLIYEDGPFDILGRFRSWIGVGWDEFSQPYGKNELAKLFTCPYCLSVWVGLLAARGRLLPGMAYSAGAVLIERLILRINRF